MMTGEAEGGGGTVGTREAGGRVTVVAAIAAVSVELLGLQFMEKLAYWRPVLL